MTPSTLDKMPPLWPLWIKALGRRPGLRPGAAVPRIHARVPMVQLDRGWLTRYARVTGTPLGDEVPLCAPQAWALPLQMTVLTAPTFPVPLLGVVHVAQRIIQRRPIALDARLTVEVWVEGHRPAKRGWEIDLHTAYDHEGEAVWSAVTTFLARGDSGDAAGGEEPAPAWPAAPADPAISAAWRLPEDLGRRFASVAGDRNPIHLHALAARPFGFKRPIIHGMWTLARALAGCGALLPASPLEVVCAFRRPLLLPGEAGLRGWGIAGGVGFEVVDGRGRTAVVGQARGLGDRLPPAAEPPGQVGRDAAD